MADKKKRRKSRKTKTIERIYVKALDRLAADYGIEAGDYFNLSLRVALDYVPGFPRFKLEHGSYGKVMRDKGGRKAYWTPERHDNLVTDVDRTKKEHGFATDDEALRHLAQSGKWARPSKQDDLTKWVKRLKNELGRARTIERAVDDLMALADWRAPNPEN
jgi:hypothetical protein